MKVYVVGGYVRDKLLGLEPRDADFVVVGSSPEEMIEKGFQQVGKDFPVFIHPITGDEYTLARVERKVGVGYEGFECDWKGVTLNEDLKRRDLTINSMAQEVKVYEDGSFKVIDYPVGKRGYFDLNEGILRPTGDHFKEDPLRVLRLARFSSKYPEFTVHEKCFEYTLDLQDELNFITPERIWIETEKSLKEKDPCKYFEYLTKWCHGFEFIKIFREMQYTVENNDYHQEDNVFVHTMMVLKHARDNWNDSEISFACLLHDIAKPECYRERGKGHGHDAEGISMIEDFCKKWKVPNNYRDLAKHVCEQHQRIHTVLGRNENNWARPKTIMSIFEKTNALSKPERFLKILKACESDAKGRIGKSSQDDYLQKPYLEDCLEAVISLDTKVISSKLLENGKSGKVLGDEIRAARINEIRKVMNNWKERLNA